MSSRSLATSAAHAVPVCGDVRADSPSCCYDSSPLIHALPAPAALRRVAGKSEKNEAMELGVVAGGGRRNQMRNRKSQRGRGEGTGSAEVLGGRNEQPSGKDGSLDSRVSLLRFLTFFFSPSQPCISTAITSAVPMMSSVPPLLYLNACMHALDSLC